MDIGVIEIAGGRLRVRKAFTMVLVERGCASRFSFAGLLRMVTRRGEGDDQCMVRMDEGEELVPAVLRRMLLGFGGESG